MGKERKWLLIQSKCAYTFILTDHRAIAYYQFRLLGILLSVPPPHTHLFRLISMLLGVQDTPHHPFYPLHGILYNNLIVLRHLLHTHKPVRLLEQPLDLHLHVSEVGRGGPLHQEKQMGGGEMDRRMREGNVEE